MLVTAPFDDAWGVGTAALRVARSATAVGAIAASARLDVRTGDAAALVRARALRAQVAARDILGHHDVEVRVAGALPRAPAIVVANHLSYLDPLVVLSMGGGVAIAKGDVARWPLVGARLEDVGVVFVERGDARSGARALRAAARALGAGVSVLNFPEGTTTDGRALRPFKRGIFGLARRLGVPVVPVRIAYDDARVCWVGEQAFVPHYAWLVRRPRIVARVRVGAPIVADGPAAALAERARAVIAAA